MQKFLLLLLVIDLSRIPIWSRQSKIQNNKTVFVPYNGEWLKRWKYPKFYGDRVFSFLGVNFMETRSSMANATLREVRPWHLRSNACKITEKIGLKFYKVTLLWANNQISYNFFSNTNKTTKFEKSLNSPG